jgi:uncharacterized RDD family membrane protein YckC
MKCSKCGYLGFETGERCRNCGYEFALAQAYELPELSIRDERDEPLFARASASASIIGGSRGGSRQTAALPLFVAPLDDDTPLITKASPPRAPLAVRRSTPDVARLRAMVTPKTTADLLLNASATPESTASLAPPSSGTRPGDTPARHRDAGVLRRLLAGVVDLLILLAIDILVVYFTMQMCGVGVREIGLLPKGPLVVFLLVQNVGYLVAFTAGGQTLGKMAAGIKVIAGDCDGSLDVGCALKRTTLSLLLAVPAGLGLLPALFDRQHRGLHDRFAGTRVVRTAA